MAGIIGKKIGMTRVFDKDGLAVPVTVLEAGPCPVVRVVEWQGGRGVQLGFGRKKARRATRAEVGHAQKSGLEAAPQVLRQFRLKSDEQFEVGQQLTVEQFSAGDRVKVTGTSKGRGFQGVMKRHGFHGRPGSHGNPERRNPGTQGPGTDPSRVIKGKRLPGHMGDARVTVRNLQVVRVDSGRNLLFVKGAVPGPRNGYVYVTK
ncbi:MAG: 50S ribosomal protein L3 [Gemmatimonadetes bacterium]|nr:50S ribosomal protein L3 [Gemmatimonadota bacterium]